MEPERVDGERILTVLIAVFAVAALVLLVIR